MAKLGSWNAVPDREGWYYGLGHRDEEGILNGEEFEVRALYQTDIEGPGTGYDAKAQAEIDRRPVLPHDALMALVKTEADEHPHWTPAEVADNVLLTLASRHGVRLRVEGKKVLGLFAESTVYHDYIDRSYIYRIAYEYRRQQRADRKYRPRVRR